MNILKVNYQSLWESRALSVVIHSDACLTLAMALSVITTFSI